MSAMLDVFGTLLFRPPNRSLGGLYHYAKLGYDLYSKPILDNTNVSIICAFGMVNAYPRP